MSFKDYLEEKKKKEQKSSEGNKTTETSSSGGFKKYLETVNNPNNGIDVGTSTLTIDDVSNWSTSVGDVSNRVYNYLKTDGYKKADTELAKELDKYLTDSVGVRRYLKANKSKYSNYADVYSVYEKQVNSLRSLRDSLNNSNKFYSKYETEDDYNADVERGNQYYNKWGHYADKEDFETTSKNRNFVNPTDEDLTYYDAMMDYNSWYTDANGKMYDAHGNEIPYVADEKGNIIHPLQNDSRFEVSDPLGLFLSTPVDERENFVYGTQQYGKKFETLQEGVVNHWEMITPDETSMYYYLLNTQGKDEALEYLRDTAETRNYKYGKKVVEDIQNIDNGFIRTISTGLLGFEAGADQWATGIANLIEGGTSPTSGIQYASAEMSNSLDGLGKYAYNATVTVGNMLPSILTSKLLGAAGVSSKFAQGVGSAVLGASAGGNAYGQALKEGYSESQAQTYGVLVGASEALLQNLVGGIGSLGGISDDILLAKTKMIDNSFLRISARYGIKIGSEIVEEELQNFLEPAFRSIIFGEDYDAPTIDEILETAVVTALSTGALEGVSTITTDAYENRQFIDRGKSIMSADGVGDLVNLANELDEKNISKLANKVSSNADNKNNSNNSARKIGRLYEMVEDATANLNQGDIVKSLVRNGFSEKEASTLAEAMIARDSAIQSVAQNFIESGFSSEEANAIASKMVEKNNSEFITSKQNRILNSYKDDASVQNAKKNILANESSTIAQRNQKLDAFDNRIALGLLSKALANAESTTEGKLSPLEENIVENEFEVSADGKTINNKNDKIVNIKKIESISKDGEVNLALDDGMVVKASDLSYGSNAEAIFISNIGAIKLGDTPISTTSANALYITAMKEFKNKPNMTSEEAVSLVQGLKDAYIFGAYNNDISQLTKTDFNGKARYYAGELTQEQRDKVYQIGRQDSVSKVDAKQKAIDSKVEQAKKKGTIQGKKGKIIFEDGQVVDETALSDVQKANLNGLKMLAELSPLNFHVFKSTKINGKFTYTMKDGSVTSANGWYVSGTNDIYIDLNAGQMGEGTMLWTAAHEISHYIRDWSPKKWQAMADFIMQEFSKQKDVSIESMLNKQIAKIKRRPDAKSKSASQIRDEAYEELVSDALSEMLVDGSVVNVLAEIKQKDKNLWQKIKEAVQDLLKRWGEILGVYEGRTLESEEAKVLKGIEDTLKKLQEMFADAFADANATFEAIGSRNLADFAEAKNTEGEALFQYRAMESDESTYRDMLKKWGKMTDAQINNLFNTIDRAMDIIKDNLEVLDYAWETDIDDRAFSPVKPNSDSLYQVSLDFSTLCRKRILQQTIQAHLQEALNQPLTREEGIAIRDALMALQEEGRQIEIACALCYVESARMKSPKQIKKFLNNREAVLKDFFATNNGGDIKAKIKQAEAETRKRLGVGDTPLTRLPSKIKREIREAKKKAKASYIPTAEEARLIEIAKGMTVNDFVTPAGLENLAKNHPKLFDAYTSYVRNATHSKGIESDTWWRAGDSQKIGDVLIANMNRENGLRSQSWSDFQVIHILDYIAATIELSTRNAKEQAYSKVPDYVELMGLTGVMINMSLIPTRDFTGSLDYDSVEGMVYKRALELRDKYPATAGTICIGIDNKQIQMLLADNTIDYVIPYHKSSMAATIRKLMHIPTWSQYEEYQSEKNLSREDAKAQAKKYGVTLLAESDSNYHKHIAFSEWFDLEVAKQIAKMENANPTDKVMHKKYGVMYGGYMAMQNAANNYLKLCAERGIAPKFSHEKADFTAEDNYWKLLIDRKMINNATGEIIEQQAIKPIFDEVEILRILNDELERYPSIKADQDYATRKVTEKFLSGEIKSGMSAEAIAEIMKTPVDNIIKTNIVASAEGEMMLSDRDSEGNELSKEQQDFFKDSKVRDAEGRLIPMYHGTPNGAFNEFKLSKNAHSSLMAQYGAGYYFDANKESAKRYTKEVNKAVGNRNPKVFEVYLNITNPLVINDEYLDGREPVITKQQFNDVVARGNYEWYFTNGMPFELSKHLGKTKEEIQQLPREEIIEHWVDMIYDRAYFDSDILSAMVRAFKGDSILQVMKDVFGNDGVKVVDKYGEMWVAWDSNQIKETTNKKPTSNPDIRYSFRNSESGMANDSLSAYNKELEKFIKQRGDYIVDSFEKLKEIVDLAFDNPNLKATAYFGIIDAKTLGKIKNSIPNLPKSSKDILFKKGRDYSIATTLDSIRHIVDEKSLNREDAINYLDRLADTILEFDSVAFNFYQKGNNKTPGLLFKKNFSDGTLVSFELVSQKKNSLVLQTLYMDSADYQKKKSAETLPMQKANGNTSKTQVGQTSANIIAEDDNSVKKLSERVTDEKTLDFLNEQIDNGEYITVYRSFQIIDGGLYAPMNAVDRDENGKSKKLGYRSELGVWEQATESPEIAQRYMDKHPNAKWASFDLDGVDNKTNGVAYNPYLHASNLVLNDQFSAAYRRNLVTVECRVPISEVGTYHAKYAKDTTGWVEWKPGGVAGKLMKVKPEYTRKLFVSRYMLPIRIIPDSEVAKMYKEYLDGTKISVPWNVVTPSLRKELVKAGVSISYKDVKGGNYTRVFSEIFPADVNESLQYSDRDSTTTTRSILANALEGVAQNDIEKNKLAEYKEKISQIEVEEQRLSEIQNKLFTKDGVEPSKRRELQFEAKQIANRINTYDRQLLRLEATKPLQNVLNREKTLAMKRQKQKDNEYLKQYKEKVAKTTRELITRNQESRKKAVESRNKTAMRHKIKKVVSDLNNLLLKPSKERHVPEEMRIAVAEALSIVNMDTVDADARVAHYNDLISKATDPDVIASLTETRDRILNQGSKLADKLTKLKEAYELIGTSEDDSLKSMYDDVIYNKIKSVQNKIGKTPLRNMTLEQLENVYDLYKMVLTTIRDSNKAFAENITMTRLALGSNTFAEIKENNKSRDRIKHDNIERFLWQNLKPMQAVKKIGSGTLQKLWNNILYGQEVFAQDYDEAVKFAKEMKDKYSYEKWNLKKLYSFESKSGKTMKISLEQMMSIYAYSKRQQADEHIEYGGIVLNEGIIEEKNKLGKTVKIKVNDSTAYRLDRMQVGTIIATLEKEAPGAKNFVDEMQKYLSETMGEKGNEVAMKMYGVRLFKEEHYFPLKSSKEFMEAANTKLKGDVKIKNKGMTKSTVEHARNPIVLENFLDVWGNHINEMALYHGLVLPLEDFSRTLNYSFKADESLNTDAESVKTALHNAFGDNAENYLNELLKAINGGVLHDSSSAIADKMISKFKKAKVMASLSVIVQQPTAIIRAMGIIEPKYFVAQNFHHKSTWEELKKYCPTAIIKETGSFDTNMGRTIVDMIKDEQGFTDKVGDFLGKAPAHMDEVGWNMIWRALKKKVAAEQKLSGEELLKESGKQMTLIINETQVYDSVMSRNELMRSKSAFTKMATAFMAEPSTVANMIYGAALDFKRGKKGIASKTLTAVITSVVINGLVSAMVYALRDDDEEKTLLEKYLSSATSEILDGINPLTYIPYVKDFWSIVQGYKIERVDMTLIKEVVDAVNNFSSKVINPEEYEGMSKEEIAKHIYENTVPLLTSICDMFGLPVNNVLRDAKAIIINDNIPMSQTSSKGIGYAVKEGAMSALPEFIQGIIGTDSKQDKLYDAIVGGDTAYIDRLKSGYKDDKAYEQAVRKTLRENDPRIKEAAEARIDGNISEYTRIVKEIKAEGFFSQDTIVASINAEINAINKGESSTTETSTEDKESSIYKMEDYYASIVGGDEATAYVVKEDIINTDVVNGKEREDAEDSFNSRFASHIREQYEDGYISEDEAKDMLVNYGDKSEEDATSKVQYWAFKQEYPNYDDLSEEAVDKYYNEVESYGISIDVYYDYSKQKAKCKGTDNNGDGKTDSGSKKAEILQVINSLPLTYAQKDALYYLNGWSAKTIYEAPWH